MTLAHAKSDQANKPSSRVTNGSTLCAFMRKPLPLARPNSPATRVMSPQGARDFQSHKHACNE